MAGEASAWTVIGVLSGTSYDAADAAAARLWFSADGETLWLRPLGLHSVPLPDELRRAVTAALPPAEVDLAHVCRLDTSLGQFFGRVAADANAALAHGRATLVASHGQTVYHWVENGRTRGTLQLGSSAWVAGATGLPVVSDLRSADVACGGQGAPLAAMLDTLLLLNGQQAAGATHRSDTGRGALNLGGIANLTARHTGGEVFAYDIGPANALLDAVAAQASGGTQTMDTSGRRAARGTVHDALLGRLLAEPYYRLPPPKSTGKELFHARYLAGMLTGLPPVSWDDVAATVTELTARIIGDACRAHGLRELVVSGGGVRNPQLMRRIASAVPGTVLTSADRHGLPAQAKEAYLFALLGFLTAHGLPGTLPGVTGADRPAVLGSITPGAEPLRLPAPRTVPPRRLRVV